MIDQPGIDSMAGVSRWVSSVSSERCTRRASDTGAAAGFYAANHVLVKGGLFLAIGVAATASSSRLLLAPFGFAFLFHDDNVVDWSV